jgi:PST family polysaccharide transporter
MSVIVRRVSGFRWSIANRQAAMLFLPLIGMVFCGFLMLPIWIATAVGTAALLVSGVYSLRAVCRLVSLDRVPRLVRCSLVWCRISAPAASELECGA